MRISYPLLSLVACLLLLAGCGKAPTARVGDIVPTTTDALTVLLIGETEAQTATRLTPGDKPLLEKGIYENVVIATDANGFSQASRGAIPVREIMEMQRQVVERVQKVLKKRSTFTAEGANFPPSPGADKTLLATLTPHTEEVGSPTDRAKGKMRTMVFIRLSITDAKTGEVLRLRDYYSGADATRR